ncbi:hypothetical protein HYZ80_03415 [Candidatus Parcubacteria bacterium]|nr:hypothetical protein [Candidatus Parcubacteria bacterium]
MSYRQRFLVTVAVSGVVLMAVVWGGIWKWLGRVKAQSDHFLALRVEQASIVEQLRVDSSFLRVGSSLEEDSRRMQATLLPRENTLDLIVNIETLARENNLRHELNVRESAAAPAAGQTDPTLSFLLELDGSFPAVIRFLSALENDTWLIAIDEIKLDRGLRLAGEGPGVHAAATLRVFVQP